MKRFLWVGLVCLLVAAWAGCGDTFRPIIIPNPPAFPDPRANHSVLSVNDNGTFNLGSGMVVNVSGDTNVNDPVLGLVPVHAVQQAPGNRIIVVNHSAAPAVGDSLTMISFLGTQVTGTSTVGLPTNSAPNFVATTEFAQAYVSLPNNVPPSVGVVNTQSNSLIAFIPVGNNPVALAETPDGKKLYVANQGSGTVSTFNTIDRSPRNNPPIGVSSPPVWLAARSDNQRVFILEANGTLAYLDTTSTAGPDVLTQTSIQVAGAVSMVYDTILNRLYIPGGNVLAVVDVSSSAPLLLSTVSMPQIPGIPAVNAVAVAVAALPDGSRAYVTSVTQSAQPTSVSISGVTGDGATATYAYTLLAGHDVTPGLMLNVAGTQSGFDGTVTVSSVLKGTTSCATTCFQVANATVLAQTPVTGSGGSVVNNIFPQVTVINTSNNSVKTTVALPGFPDATNLGSPYFAPVCATTRFRFGMAAGGDSTKVYLSSCDGGTVDVVRTSDDTFVLNIPAPSSARAPIPPNPEPPAQNPVFLLAGP